MTGELSQPLVKRLQPLNPQSTLAPLFAAPMRPGVVVWLGLRPGRRLPMHLVSEITLTLEDGVNGDRYGGRPGGSRQVTLMQAEHLAAIGSYLGIANVRPEWLRRNIVVSGLNLLAVKAARFQLAGAVLEATGECHPCSRMEEILGAGGYNAVRGHGGITARVLTAGVVQIGDAVTRAD